MVGVLVAVAVVAVVAVLLASWSGGYGMMGSGWGWGRGMAMLVVPLVFLVVVVLLLVTAFAPRGGSYPSLSPESLATAPAALEILNTRYARNEISREEYLQKKVDLTGALSGER